MNGDVKGIKESELGDAEYNDIATHVPGIDIPGKLSDGVVPGKLDFVLDGEVMRTRF